MAARSLLVAAALAASTPGCVSYQVISAQPDTRVTVALGGGEVAAGLLFGAVDRDNYDSYPASAAVGLLAVAGVDVVILIIYGISRLHDH